METHLIRPSNIDDETAGRFIGTARGIEINDIPTTVRPPSCCPRSSEPACLDCQSWGISMDSSVTSDAADWVALT